MTGPLTAARSGRLSRRTFVRQVAGLGALALLTGCDAGTRSAATPQRVRRIGFLGQQPRGPGIDSLRRALRDRGLIEGRDFTLVSRYANDIPDRLPSLATELVELPVDILFTIGGLNPTRAAALATSTIPIVFTNVPDPVEQGIVASLARPGGNVTGMTGKELTPKRVELLMETVPGLERLPVLGSARNAEGFAIALRRIEDTAPSMGVNTIEPLALDGIGELDQALNALARQRQDGLIQDNNFAWFGGRSASLAKLLDFAIAQRLPQIHRDPEFARAGGLMALRPNNEARWRIAARQIDRILQGANPADLPVELNDVYDVALNLSTARKIGLTFPESVLLQATEIIQ